MAFDLGGAITGAVIGFTKGGWWGAAAGFVIGGLTSGDAKRSARNKARSAFNDAQRDRDQMIQSATAPHKIVYGRARVSGPIAYAQSTGSRGEFMHLVVVLAGHECDAVETVYFNDTPLTLDGSGNVTDAAFARTTTAQWIDTVACSGGSTTAITLSHTPVVSVLAGTVPIVGNEGGSSPVALVSLVGAVATFTTAGIAAGTVLTVAYDYTASSTPLVQIKAYLGTTTQTADAGLVSASGGKWTSAHRLRGLCYLYVRMEYDQDVFGATGLPDVSAVVRGRKVWDPRTSTTAWRDNSALCAADYLRTYMGAAAGEVIDSELTAEANACDEAVTIATGVTEARYTCNGVLTTEAAPRDNLDAIVESMAGTVVWAQGRYVIRAGRHLSAEFTLTEDMLADGPVTIQPDAARTELINRVVAKYTEPAKAWTAIEAPPVTNATYVSDDGGLDLPESPTLDMVIGAMRAQRLAKIMLERNRQGLRVQLNCNLRAYDVAPGNVVAVTISRYGWSAKLFVVEDRSHDLTAQTVRLSLRETAAAVWDWNFGAATTVDLTPNTSLPNAYAKPGALTGLAVASGTSWLQRMGDGTIQCRASVSWTLTSDVQVQRGGRIEVRYGRADGVTWVQVPPVAGDATSAVVGPLEEGWVHLFAVRAVTGVGVAGPWSYVAHQPVGKSAAPANVANLAASVVPGNILIAWTASTEADYAYTELRRGASWADGVAMDGSAVAAKPTRITASSYLWTWPASGSYTVWAAHVDTSGNVSAAPASVAVTVDGSILVGAAQFAGDIGGGNMLANSSMDLQTSALPAGYIDYNSAGISITRTGPAGRTGGLAYGVKANAPTTTELLGLRTDSGVSASGVTGGVRGGWQPGRTYVVSWWARKPAAGAAWTGMLNAWNVPPASTVVLLNPVPSTAWQRYARRITWGASVVPAGRLYIVLTGNTATNDEIQIDDIQVTEGDVLTAWSPSSADIAAAQATADAANAALANIASDSILSPSEKPAVVQDYAVITGEQSGIDAQATAYGITTEKTAYDSAITTLTTYLGGLTGWNTVPGSDVAIVGTTFRANFAAVYTARQALLNKIAAAAGTVATWSGVSGSGKPADNATVGAQAGVNLKDSGGAVLADAAVKNSAITVNADGTLSGAGAGQVSLTALPGSVATGQIDLQAATTVVSEEVTFSSSSYTGSASTAVGFISITNSTADNLAVLLTGTAEFNWPGPIGTNSTNAGNTLLVDLKVNGSVYQRVVNELTFVYSGTSVKQAYKFSYSLALAISAGQTLTIESYFGGSTATGSRNLVSIMRAELIKR